jgi:pimeloyl-ACP methyl ester carboxylesterase
MAEFTVILHGWSDCSESFVAVKDFLRANGYQADTIYYADYESREDNITFSDVVDGLHDRFVEKGFIQPDGTANNTTLNVVVHSTGGLIIRHWIWRYYARDGRIADCPVKRIVMLAPANFGSPLAHRGKSFVGSIFKGRWKFGDLLEVGRQLLDGLELGSPYQWWLAHNDLVLKKPYYRGDGIQVTILVGIEDYEGIRSWVNKPGTDGTVVIAGTCIDTAKLTLNVSDPNQPLAWDFQNPVEDFAFGVLPQVNHGSIVDAAGVNSRTSGLLLRALRCNNAADFKALQAELDQETKNTYAAAGKPKYQQFIVRAIDDQDAPVSDYTLEFYVVRASKRNDAGNLIANKRLSAQEDDFSQKIHDVIAAEFHTHSKDSSYRRFLMDVQAAKKLVQDAAAAFGEPAVVSMRVAVPDIDQGISYDTRRLNNVVLFDPQATAKLSFFYENTTTLAEIRVDRKVNDRYVRVDRTPKKH